MVVADATQEPGPKVLRILRSDFHQQRQRLAIAALGGVLARDQIMVRRCLQRSGRGHGLQLLGLLFPTEQAGQFRPLRPQGSRALSDAAARLGELIEAQGLGHELLPRRRIALIQGLQGDAPRQQQKQLSRVLAQQRLIGRGKMAQRRRIGPGGIVRRAIGSEHLATQLNTLLNLRRVVRPRRQQVLDGFLGIEERAQRLASLDLGKALAAEHRDTQKAGDHEAAKEQRGRGRSQARMPAPPLAGAFAHGRFGGMAERQIFEMPIQVFLQLPGILITPIRIRLQAVTDNGLDRGRDRFVPAAYGRGRSQAVMNHFFQDLLDRPNLGRERLAAREHLEQDHAERIDVAAEIQEHGFGAESLDLLGGHERQGAAGLGCGGVVAQLRVLGEVEIQKHRLAVVGQKDVGRLQIAVHNATLVGVRQAVGEATGDPQRRLDVAEPLQLLQVGSGLRAGQSGRRLDR